MTQYEEGLMAAPVTEGAALGTLQTEIQHYSGRDIPVVMTEYGQLVTPMPTADPRFNFSLDEGLLVAAQLEEWATHGVPLAEKYLLDSVPFLATYPCIGLSKYSAMHARPGPNFLVERTGQVLGLISRLVAVRWRPDGNTPVICRRLALRFPRRVPRRGGAGRRYAPPGPAPAGSGCGQPGSGPCRPG